MRVELHFHLLPGVDDGPRDMAESLALARVGVADGTRRLVATPHASFVDARELRERVAAVQAALDAAGIPLRVLPGAECLPSDVHRLGARGLELVAQGPPGRRWVLLEAPFGRRLGGLHEAAGELRDRGYGVVLAHPERCECLWGGDGALERELARGARLLVNASSIAGAHGPVAERRGLELVEAGVVTALASDAHNADRPPRLSEAEAALLAAGIPAPTAAALTGANAVALLDRGFTPQGARLAA